MEKTLVFWDTFWILTIEPQPGVRSRLAIGRLNSKHKQGRITMTHYNAKYNSDLSIADITKAIRADLKLEFPGWKFSVRKTRYNAIDVSVHFAPVSLYNPEWVKQHKSGTYDYHVKRYSSSGNAIMDKIEKIADAYNFDGSDIQSDYFHVNYYLHVTIDYSFENSEIARIWENFDAEMVEHKKAEFDLLPVCGKCGGKTCNLYEGMCWTCFSPIDDERRKIETERCERERLERDSIVAPLKEYVSIPTGSMSRMSLREPTLNKCSVISEYREQLKKGEYVVVSAVVSHKVVLSPAHYDIFCANMLEDFPWLEKLGGTGCDVDFGEKEVWQLNQEELATFRASCYSLVVAVISEGRETVYIDPQGYNYARYALFAVPQSKIINLAEYRAMKSAN